MKSLRVIRREKNVAAEELALASETEIQRFWRIERGHTAATIDEGLTWARMLGVPLEDLTAEPVAPEQAAS